MVLGSEQVLVSVKPLETRGAFGLFLNARGNANVWVDNIIQKCSLRTEVFGLKNRGIDEEGE